MTITQAIVKVRDDIISWCTLNFKKKADVTTTNEMKAKLDTLSVHPTHTSRSVTGAVNLTVNSLGHVTAASNGTYVKELEPTAHEGGFHVARGMSSTEEEFNIYSPSISEMCKTESIVLTNGVQYGNTTPSNPVNGQLFFLKVEE